jgi:DNA-binding NtrC family response regulator
MSGPHRILIVDDDRAFRLSTGELLRQDGHAVDTAVDAAEAVERLGADAFDLVVLDLRMPGIDGLTLVEILRKRGHDTPVLMISGFGTIDSAVESLHRGADHFLTKPVDPDVLSAKVAELLERRPSEARVRDGALGSMVGHSRSMRDVFDAVRRVAPTDTTVLLVGETGTGKELLARAVHDLSARAAGPFVPVNCAALAEGVLESELFGHVRGAFTGAHADRDGFFAAAEGGTLFLDEVGDIGLAVQQRLLRALQEREVTPVGSSRPRRVDVRVVAATHRALEREMSEGRFRDDLYYRLNVFRIDVPPLRERASDVPLLVEAALTRLRERAPYDRALAVSALAMRLLRGHEWRGNVRELFAVVESAAVRAGGRRIEAQHLPAPIRDPSGGNASSPRYSAPADADERAAILAALDATDGVKQKAADLLGMSRTTLWRRMRDLDLGNGE